MTLDDLKNNQCAIITKINIKDHDQRRRLLDLGFVVGKKIKLIFSNIGIKAFLILETQISLRRHIARQIEVRIEENTNESSRC